MLKSGLRDFILWIRGVYQRRWQGLDIHPTARMSLTAKLDTSFKAGLHIGAESYIAFNARIMTHDFTRGLYLHTRIGKRCFIGGQSIILPGVTIGDDCIVGAGSVVTKDVPDKCAVAGNPAKIISRDLEVEKFGRLVAADENERELRETDPAAAQLSDRKFRQKHVAKK